MPRTPALPAKAHAPRHAPSNELPFRHPVMTARLAADLGNLSLPSQEMH